MAVDRHEVAVAAARGGRGARRARTVERALQTLSFQLSGAQLGITVSSLVLGFVVDNAIGPLVRPLLSWVPGIENGTLVALTAAVALVAATIVQMVLGELTPKNLAIARPLPTAQVFVPPMALINTLVRPVIWLLNAGANGLLRLVGLTPREELEGVQSLDDLREALRWAAQEHAAAGIKYDLLDRALSLGRKTVSEVLVPRSQVVAISTGASLADLARRSHQTGYSRLPVRGPQGQEYVGVAHVKDVLALPPAARARTPVATLTRQALTVPADRDLRSLLLEMQSDQHAMVLVGNEFGDAIGIITLEDVIEELLGDIEDEYDKPEPASVSPLDDGAYDVVAQISRSDLEAATGFSMPEGPFETLGGLLLARLQRVPRTGDTLTLRGWRVRVASMQGQRIVRVRLDPPDAPAGGEA